MEGFRIDEVKELRAELEDAFEELTMMNGVRFSIGKITFDPAYGNASFKVEAVKDGGVSKDESDFTHLMATQAYSHEFKLIDFESGQQEVRLIGYKSNRKKYPWVVVNRDGVKSAITKGTARRCFTERGI